jgi:beta-lactamase regulating signal transducer with metallopeptidase domain
MLCVLYVNAVTALLCIIVMLVERVLPADWPRRWLWCGALAISIALPGYYRNHHSWSVAQIPADTAVDTTWWSRIDAFDSTIHDIWLVSSALLIAWGVVSIIRVAIIVRNARRASLNPSNIDEVPVVVTDLTGPATVGLLRPHVLVPRWVLALPGPQRRYVLRHEDEHRKAHDARLLFIASMTLILMPWNLALWWHLRRLRLAVEMDCDSRVVGALGDARAYGELLLKVAQASSRGPSLQPALLGVGMLERRLTQLVAPAPLKHAHRFLLPAVAIGLLFIVFKMPHPVFEHTPTSHATMTSQAHAGVK